MKHFNTYFRTLILLAAMVLGAHVNVWGWTWTGVSSLTENWSYYLYNDLYSNAKGTGVWLNKNPEGLMSGSNSRTVAVGTLSQAVPLTYCMTSSWGIKYYHLKDASNNYLHRKSGNYSWDSKDSDNSFDFTSKGNNYFTVKGDNRWLNIENCGTVNNPTSATSSGKSEYWKFITVDEVNVYNNRFFYFQADPQVGDGDGGSVTPQEKLTYELANYADRNNTHSQTLTFQASADVVNGYQFDGWYNDEACTDFVSRKNPYTRTINNSVAGSTETLTLYAHFVQEQDLTIEKNTTKISEFESLKWDGIITDALDFVHADKSKINVTYKDNGSSIATTTSDVLDYDLANNKIIAKHIGTTKIILTQTEKSDGVKAGTVEINVTVIRHSDGTLDITNVVVDKNTWNLDINLADNITTTSDGAIVVGASSDADVCTYADGKFHVGTKTGTATFEISVPQTDKYEAITIETFTVKVDAPFYAYAKSIIDAAKTNIPTYNNSVYLTALEATHNQTDAESVLGNLRDNVRDYLAENNPADIDVTFLLNNHSFEYEDHTYGWQIISGYSAQEVDGHYALRMHAGSVGEIQSGYAKQVVNLPAGKYRLAVYAKMEYVDDAIFTFSDIKKEIDRTSGATFSIEKELVASADVIISFEHPKQYDTYAKTVIIDDFQLQYLGKINDPITWDAFTLTAGENKTMVASTAYSRTITFTSSDETIVSIDSDGKTLIPHKAGNVTITASADNSGVYSTPSVVREITVNYAADAFIWTTIEDSYEVEGTIPALATANSGLAVTYTSSNEAVIKIIDGVITTIGKGTATLTAHTAGNHIYASIEESKTITVHPHEQYIDWNQSFIDIVKNGDNFSRPDIALDALAKDMNGNNTDVNIIYSVPTDNGVATISDNILHLIGDGTITITATTADDSKYATVSITKEVRVRVYGSKCDSYLPVTGGTQKADGNNEKVWTWDNPTGDLVAPGTKNVTFHASVSALMAGRSLTVSQKIGEEWIVITDRDEAPGSGSSKTIGCTVATNATGLKVQYTGTGWGSCTVSDVLVPMNSYIATVDASSFTGSAVAYNEITTNAVTIKYADVPLIEYEITDFTNGTDDNTLDASSLTVTPVSRADLSNDCGNYGTYSFVISGTFNKVGTITANLRLHTSANDELKIPITLTINPATRTIHWDSEHTENVPAYTTYDLDAYCTTANENPAGKVHYEITSDGDNATIENGILTFIKPGLVTVTATPVENKEYSDPVDSKVVRSWSVQQRKAEVTILEGFVKKEFTYMDVRSASDFDITKYEAKDEVSKATVSGTLSYVDEGTNYISITGQQVKFTFTPSDDAVYNPVTVYVPVTVNPATPSVTFPTTESTTYVADMTLDNINLIGGSATFNGDVEGTFAWEVPTTAIGVVNSGSAYTVVFTPSSANFASVEENIAITITKADPVVSAWPTTEAIKMRDGLTLNDIVLNDDGSASVAGEFAWDAPTTVLAEGTNSYSVTFTPTDAANYNTAVSTVSVTILPAKIIYDGTDWSNIPNAGDDVLITGDLVIDTDLEVNGMTIDNGVKVTLTVNGSLTINGESDSQTNYGDLIINAGGQVVLHDAANLQVRNLELNTELGNRETAAKSSQVSNAEKLHINGQSYIDITLDATGTMTYGWYDFALPFDADVRNNVYYVDASGNEHKLTEYKDYVIMSFSEVTRAANKNGWSRFTGTLRAGVGYTITLDEAKNQNTLRFKANTATLADNSSRTLSYTNSSNAQWSGWNTIGNGTLAYAEVQSDNDNLKVQIFDHHSNSYVTIAANDYTFVVGSPFCVQAAENNESLVLQKAKSYSALLAPQRVAASTNDEFAISIIGEKPLLINDQLFVSAEENASAAYEAGHDLTKMGTVGEASVPQIWSTEYQSLLSDVELPLIDQQASTTIGLYAPEDNIYTLRADKVNDDQQLYLTQNGYPIWNLSASPYSLYLMQGTTNEYGLLIVSSPKVATDINGIFGAEQAEKIIFNNKVYILRSGMIFDATGKKIQ